MPVTFQEQPQQSINQQAAELKNQRRLAEILRKSAQQDQNPNVTVGSGPYQHVVAINPLVEALKGVSLGVSDYTDSKADKAEAALEDRRLQATQEAFAGGQMDYGKLASTGIDPAMLAKLMIQQQQQNQAGMSADGYRPPIATSDGFLQYDPQLRSWKKLIVDNQVAMPGQYDIPLQSGLRAATEGQKIVKYKDEDNRESYAPAHQVNPEIQNVTPRQYQAPQNQTGAGPSRFENLPVRRNDNPGQFENLPLAPNENVSFNFANPEQAAKDLQTGIADDPYAAAQAKYDAFTRDSAARRGSQIKGLSFQEQERIKADEDIRKKQAEAQIKSQQNANKKSEPFYDAGSDEFVYPPTEEYPGGRRTMSQGRINAANNIKYIAQRFTGTKEKPGPIYTTPTGGFLGLKGQLARLTDDQKVKAFNNLKEQMSTELRTIFRIPGEGALSDKEQAQNGLQLPDINNEDEVNEQIIQDILFRTNNRLQTPGPADDQQEPKQPGLPQQPAGIKFMGFE